MRNSDIYNWLVVFRPTPLKNDGVKVSWDDDIPNIWKNKIHVPNHQLVNVTIQEYTLLLVIITFLLVIITLLLVILLVLLSSIWYYQYYYYSTKINH